MKDSEISEIIKSKFKKRLAPGRTKHFVSKLIQRMKDKVNNQQTKSSSS